MENMVCNIKKSVEERGEKSIEALNSRIKVPEQNIKALQDRKEQTTG